MKRLIITADLGHIKVYRVTRDSSDEKPSIELESDNDVPNQYSRFDSRDTDAAGRFPRGGSSQTPSGMSYGERHGEKAEEEKSQLRKIANLINEAVSREKIMGFYLAAPQPIHRRLIESLAPDVQSCLIEAVAMDLNKTRKLDLLHQFKLTSA